MLEDLQETASKELAPVGIVWTVQVVPPFVVDNTKPPFGPWPTATPTASQRFAETHETLCRRNAVVAMSLVVQVVPPFEVVITTP
jgi:hypothetical protein